MGFFGGVSFKKVQEVTGMYSNDFQYTPAALRMSKVANGVSQLHGEVARNMWREFDRTCEIKSITNAQDEVYWTDNQLSKAFQEDDDEALVNRKKELKRALFKIVSDQEGDLFDENILTIVWARRFAGYKRADLIFRDMERFEQMINRLDRPVQIIWAGKPYPEDSSGISQFNYIKGLTFYHKGIAILTGYELELSASLKRGADLWLNTPRRPQEASGTSGMTAAMNGAINLSVLDGWIPEFCKDGQNSFVLPIADTTADHYRQDNEDHENLMQMLEDVIIPMYYEQPQKWVQIMKNSMRDVKPQFDSKRMTAQYYEEMYNY